LNGLGPDKISLIREKKEEIEQVIEEIVAKIRRQHFVLFGLPCYCKNSSAFTL
jgi:hypothetical protein